MTKLLTEFSTILQSTPKRLVDIDDADAEKKPAAGRWSKKEILGHLIDSASNNHQRFVRAQFASHSELPTYQQESWVAVQAYATESWPDLVNLWLLYNRHLLHVIRQIPEAALGRPCTIGTNAAIPLAEVIQGYIDHLEHHLQQILGQ